MQTATKDAEMMSLTVGRGTGVVAKVVLSASRAAKAEKAEKALRQRLLQEEFSQELIFQIRF